VGSWLGQGKSSEEINWVPGLVPVRPDFFKIP